MGGKNPWAEPLRESTPNQRLQATANSLRSYLALATGGV
jgi:hypothetical protein